jgi:predicted urease superfamily metal-dependent hydrolase
MSIAPIVLRLRNEIIENCSKIRNDCICNIPLHFYTIEGDFSDINRQLKRVKGVKGEKLFCLISYKNNF